MAARNRLRQHVQQQLWKEPLIGEGTLGKTYKVSGLEGEELALKVSTLKDATQKEEQYFKQEVETLSRFDHSHIIKYIDGWEICPKGGPLSVYLLTAYASGRDLKHYLYEELKKPPPEVTYGSWLAQIASGLEFMHSMSVIHRNLKTSNILVDLQDSQVVLKIGDFGMSKVLDHPNAMAMSMVGTPYFMSPEVLRGVSYNSKTDIWSLGCTAYEIATLTTIFQAKTITTLLSGVHKDAAARLAEQIKYSDFFRKLIRNMLNQDCERRPDAGWVLKALLDQGYTTSCTNTDASTSESSRRHRTSGSTKSSSTSFKGHRHSRTIPEDGSSTGQSSRSSSRSISRTSSRAGSIPSVSMEDSDSMVVYNVSNPHWNDIGKRNVKGVSGDLPVIPSILSGSKGRLRTRSEGGLPPETEAALAAFTVSRRKKHDEQRLSRSGPVKSVSFDTPRTNTSGYNSGEDEQYSQGHLSENGDDHVDLVEGQSRGDEERLITQIGNLQTNLALTLGEDVFQVAFNTLRILDDDKMEEELKSVLGEKYNDFSLQFATLRLLERRASDYEKPSQKKGGTLHQTI